MKELTIEERKRVEWIIGRIEKWYAVRERYIEGNPSMADVGHSALLWRLLSGDEALEYPPPRSFSYPNYHAAEGNQDVPMEVWFKDDGPLSNSISYEGLGERMPEQVYIDQARWDVVRRDGESFVIKWKTDPAEWRLERLPEEDRTHEKYYQWSLQRVMEDD